MLADGLTRIAITCLCCGVLVAGAAVAAERSATRPANELDARVSPRLFLADASEARMVLPAQVSESAEDEKEILVVQALEQPTTLNIEDMPIVEAVRMLSEQTGVPIEFDQFALGCLPYGSKTLVTARIENQPLRDSIVALLRPLACKPVLSGAKLVIQPRPALFRICRRATWDEVALIEKLYATPWSKELAESLKFQFQDMSTTDAEENRKKLFEIAESVGDGHAARVLELASHQYGWEWHPQGADTIVFATRTRQIELQLQRLVTAQYSEMQLKDVLLDLAGRAGVPLKLEPGVLATLPTHLSERFRLTVENVTIRQALELIAGETGLGYFIGPEGIRITADTFTAGETSSASVDPSVKAMQELRSNPIVGQITFPGEDGTTYGFFIREQDLPPEVNELRKEHLRKAVEHMREAMTQPAR